MKNLEIYIHIPFCVKKCAYCDFLSAPASMEAQRQYLLALLQEPDFREARNVSALSLVREWLVRQGRLSY